MEEVAALIIGVMVMLAVFLSLSRFFDINNSSVKKSLALFSAATGLLSTLWLRVNPTVLRDYWAQIAVAGILVVLVLLRLGRK